jgi:RHS repeat-associated protein
VIYRDGIELDTVDAKTRTYQISGTTPGDVYEFSVLARNLNGDWSEVQLSSTMTVAPPDPVKIAPSLPVGAVGSFSSRVSFLNQGDHPVQFEVQEEALDADRLSVVRGCVKDRSGQPLAGVRVSLRDCTESGYTYSRADGMFDLVANGGGALFVDYEREGFLSAQRTVRVEWNEITVAPDVVLIPLDPAATPVEFGASAMAQVAESSVVTDEDGARCVSAIFSPGTGAYVVGSDGASNSVDQLTVRATEYTVGDSGLEAMPGELRAPMAYTYCVEYSADEVTDGRVEFTQPVAIYFDNFLDFPVGLPIPVAWYDDETKSWIAENNGTVVDFLGPDSSGLALIDCDGDGIAESLSGLLAAGYTEDELLLLAQTRTAGSYWRTTVTHFTPYDWNYSYVSELSSEEKPQTLDIKQQQTVSDASTDSGHGTIAIENRNFNEALAVSGTPFNLHYESSAHRGNMMEIPLSGETLSSDVKRVNLSVQIAGKTYTYEYDPVLNLSCSFQWDGLDAYGYPCASAMGKFTLSYLAHGRYSIPASNAQEMFGRSGMPQNVITNQQGEVLTRQLLSSSVQDRCLIETPEGIDRADLGGWALDVNHLYDPKSGILFYGDGRRDTPKSQHLLDFSDGGNGPLWGYGTGDVVSAPDGTVYLPAFGAIYRVKKTGVTDIIIGGVYACAEGEVGTDWYLGGNVRLAVDSAGALYFSDTSKGFICRWTEDQGVVPIAGMGESDADGTSCDLVHLNEPEALYVADDGCIIYTEPSLNRVRCIYPDGKVYTVAGDGTDEYRGDGAAARQAGISSPCDVAVASDGSLYIAGPSASVSGEQYYLRKMDPQGIVHTVFDPQIDGMGDSVTGVCVDADDVVWFLEDCSNGTKVWRLDSNGVLMFYDGTFTGETFNGIATLPDGDLLLRGESGVKTLSQKFSVDKVVSEYSVKSLDENQLFCFDAHGRHLFTLDAQTGQKLYSFEYDSAGRLLLITDLDGLQTVIERDDSGAATAIIASHGQRTELEINAERQLAAVRNPAGEVVTLAYNETGLLTDVVSRRGYRTQIEYDDTGLFSAVIDPEAEPQTVETLFTSGATQTVRQVTAAGITNLYTSIQYDNGETGRTIVNGAGLTNRTESTDMKSTSVAADGTQVYTEYAPHPYFGMRAKYPAYTQTTLPSGRTLSVTSDWTAVYVCDTDFLALDSSLKTQRIQDRVTRSEYARSNRTSIVTSPEGRITTVQADEKGRPVLISAPNRYPVVYNYNAEGRLVETCQGEGAELRRTTFQYDSAGWLASVTNALQQTVSNEVDAIGRVVRTVRPDGTDTQLAYNRSSVPVSITLPNGQQHTYTNNPVNLPARYTPPELAGRNDTEWYRHDDDRRLTSTLKPDGTVISNRYDMAGRLAETRVYDSPSDDRTIDYQYDPATGSLTAICEGSNQVAYDYDGGLLTNITVSGAVNGQLTLGYNDYWELAEIDLNGDLLADYEYDDDGLLIRAGSLDYIRDPVSGDLLSSVCGTVSDSIALNLFGELTNYSASASSAVLCNVSYRRDSLGRITEKTETTGGTTHVLNYQYDAIGQITNVLTDGISTESYRYDANGNRLSAEVDGVVSIAEYDAQDRMIRYGDTIFAYDVNGTTLSATNASGGVTTYDYGDCGELRGVGLADGTDISYEIDPLNRRIGKSINGTPVQQFIYQDALNPVAELDGDGTITATFIYGAKANVPELMVKNGTTYRLITDQVGSVRLVVNADDGTIAQRIDYDSFGRVVADSNPGFQPFGFQGGLTDPLTGLVRFGARDYDPQTGRWRSKDPIGISGGLNLYVFCGNNSVNFIDSSGLCEEKYSKEWWREKYREVTEWFAVADLAPIGNVPIIGQLAGEGVDILAYSLAGGELLGDFASGDLSFGQFAGASGLNFANLLVGTAGNATSFVGDTLLSAAEYAIASASEGITSGGENYNIMQDSTDGE